MKQTPKETIVEPSNAFSTLLNTHRKGLAGHECSTFLERALAAAVDTGAKAEVIVKVTILPGPDNQVNITIQPTSKLPQQKLAGSIFWVDEDFKLVTRNPNQPDLPLREVIAVGQAKEVREAKEA
jgi:hypothetical protein